MGSVIVICLTALIVLAQPRGGNRLAPDVVFQPDIAYSSIPTCKLDLLRPRNAGAQPLPIVVWVHGGGWRSGTRKNVPQGAIELVKRGFVVASVEYRLTGEASFPAQIADCRAAVRWLRSNAKQLGIDEKRMGAWGKSAGGHLVSLLGTGASVRALDGDTTPPAVSCAVQAVADFCGPADFTALARQPLPRNRALQRADNERAPESLLLGGAVQNRQEMAALASPITHIDGDEPPFLIVHGEKDTTVHPQQSRNFAAALTKKNIPCTLHIRPDETHNLLRESEALAVEFFAKTLAPVAAH